MPTTSQQQLSNRQQHTRDVTTRTIVNLSSTDLTFDTFARRLLAFFMRCWPDISPLWSFKSLMSCSIWVTLSGKVPGGMKYETTQDHKWVCEHISNKFFFYFFPLFISTHSRKFPLRHISLAQLSRPTMRLAAMSTSSPRAQFPILARLSNAAAAPHREKPTDLSIFFVLISTHPINLFALFYPPLSYGIWVVLCLVLPKKTDKCWLLCCWTTRKTTTATVDMANGEKKKKN